MKYINRFSTNAEYQSFTEGERYITPNVCYINEASGVTMKPYVQPSNIIYYTSSDNNIVTPYNTNVFGANIISNIYEDGQGIIKFDSEINAIGDKAFWGCSKLTSISIPNSVNTFGKEIFRYCTGLTSITIPNSVTTIDFYAFGYCSNLTSVTIPYSITTIGSYAFDDCDKLTNVTIGNNVETIGVEAFDNCGSLTSVTIPDSVTSIGNSAFRDCSSLTSVYCKATTPPSLGGSNVFDNNTLGRKIYVPTASVAAYKTATYWNEYVNDIIGYDF